MLILREGDESFIVEGYSREELLDMLKDNTVVVSFRKKSTNKDRIMYCTRDLSKIPSSKHPSGVGLPYNDPNVVPVFDLVKKAWRSFRIERVKEAEVRRVGFLTRLFRRKKYTQDQEVKESFQGPLIEAYELDETRISFRRFVEAAGDIHQGEVSVVNEPTFRARAVQITKGINARLSKGGKIRNHGKIGPGTLYCMTRGGMGLAFLTLSKEPAELATEDLDSIVFVCELHEVHPDAPDINSFATYVIEQPYVSPAYQGSGLGAKVYGQFSLDYNIMADSIQSRQGRRLWNKMVREGTFKYVYVYSEVAEEIEEEISGNEGRFQQLMKEGDDDLRFIGTSQKAKSF